MFKDLMKIFFKNIEKKPFFLRSYLIFFLSFKSCINLTANLCGIIESVGKFWFWREQKTDFSL